MNRSKHQSPAVKAAIQLAHARVVAALTCVNVLCPDLNASGKRLLVNQILSICDGKNRFAPRKEIADGQVVEMVWRNMQCIYQKCPLLIFGKQLSEEINEVFGEER
jgi:hypothetical protein